MDCNFILLSYIETVGVLNAFRTHSVVWFFMTLSYDTVWFLNGEMLEL